MVVRAFLGLDVGTQSVKGRAIDEEGNLLAEATTEYPLYIPQPGWTEQEPLEMWEAVKRDHPQSGECPLAATASC